MSEHVKPNDSTDSILMAKVLSLNTFIEKCDREYYDGNGSTVTDAEYDGKKMELSKLIGDHPEFIDLAPSLFSVGFTPTNTFAPFSHAIRMLSLDNIHTYEQLQKFCNNTVGGGYCLEHKVDGLAIKLVYKLGRLYSMSTRGDGSTGEDITYNLGLVNNLPFFINDLALIPYIEICGEAAVYKKDFGLINTFRKIMEMPPYATCRNAASGIIRGHNFTFPKPPIHFIAYSIPNAVNALGINKQDLVLDWLTEKGFTTSSIKCSGDLNAIDISLWLEDVSQRRADIPYDIDGVVIKVNDLKLHAELGETTRHPKGAIAFKFEPSTAVTTLLGVIPQVGRTGAITPVGVTEMVNIGGVSIDRVNLHNYGNVFSKRLWVGCKVVIARSCDLIPVLIGKHDDGKEDGEAYRTNFVKIPTECPSCGNSLNRKGGLSSNELQCVNTQCPDVLLGKFDYFCSKAAMDIKGLGKEILSQLINHGLLKRFSDIYNLTAESLNETVKGLGLKNSVKIVAAINDSKANGHKRLLTGLGILGVGPVAAGKLIKSLGNIENLLTLRYNDFLNVRGIGTETAGNIISYFSVPNNVSDVLRLVKIITHSEYQHEGKFFGKNFAITGWLGELSRSELISKLASMGAIYSNTVSKQTDFIVVGFEPGNKYQKALSLGVKVITCEELPALLNQ